MKCCDGDRETRRAAALGHLVRAHSSGALGELAGASLGDLTAGAWFSLDRSSIDAETEAFDGRLNAWLVDYQAATSAIPAAVIQQIDDFVARWRDLRSSWYFIGKVRADAIMAMEAEWNRFRDQVAGYAGRESAVEAATVLVDGKAVRADQIPPGSSTLDRVETIVKWGAVLVAGVAGWKIASDLGLVAKVSHLFSGGGAAAVPGRRFGSAKRNPRRRRRNPRPRNLADAIARCNAAAIAAAQAKYDAGRDPNFWGRK